ncbi:TPA: hypothetical protein IAC10_02570 [Candidatus Scatousia excrementigallinarum]|uniref:Uncharacterized protein n=1 Tax=Candidatus Scatousia excrementigallinarum TaxID=2840935 RepID=A0A9D1EY04_9BACT|nr:hypothetical protein [Candidatus Scatousia excrementigallinarum]
MKNLSKNQLSREVLSQTNDEIKAESKAVANETVTAEDILFSLKPLLDEYFVGTISCDKTALTYQTVSGQKFRIAVTKEA